MRIIIAPAKQMIVENDILLPEGSPVYLSKTSDILSYLKSLSYVEAKELWECSDKIADLSYEILQNMNLDDNLSPSILSYDGIAFKYMAPTVFAEKQFSYVQEHLRILSGFYGVLKPMDGVIPYRLEMKAKIKMQGYKSLYEYWEKLIYDEVQKDNDDHIIINLASKEYSKCIEKYLEKDDKYITCIFGEIENSKIVQKGVYAKMARGEMVRYMAELNSESIDDIKGFNRLGYSFNENLSSENELVFIK